MFSLCLKNMFKTPACWESLKYCDFVFSGTNLKP